MIRVSDAPTHEFRKECPECGHKIGFQKCDLKSAIHYDYGGGSDTYNYLKCPKCNHTIEVDTYRMTKHPITTTPAPNDILELREQMNQMAQQMEQLMKHFKTEKVKTDKRK